MIVSAINFGDTSLIVRWNTLNPFYLMIISITPSVCLSVSVSEWLKHRSKNENNVKNVLRVWLLQI